MNQVNMHKSLGKEQILKRMNLKGEELVLTSDTGTVSKTLFLYKKHNIAEGLDTYEKVATKHYSQSKGHIEWQNQKGSACIDRNWDISRLKNVKKNAGLKAWSLVNLKVDDSSLFAKFIRYSQTNSFFSNFELRAHSSELTPKAARAVKLLSEFTRNIKR